MVVRDETVTITFFVYRFVYETMANYFYEN